MKHTLEVKVKLIKKAAKLPRYHSSGAAGADVSACLSEPIALLPGERAVIPTGLAFEIPKGYEIQVRARSGLSARHGIGLMNGVGTIDSDYRGELAVILVNLGDEEFMVEDGMRVAQIVVSSYETVKFHSVDSLSHSERGNSRFGSTGV